MNNIKKYYPYLIIPLVLLTVAFIARQQTISNKPKMVIRQPSPQATSNCLSPDNATTSVNKTIAKYTSRKCAFSLQIPANWNISESESSQSVSFSDVKNPASLDPESRKGHVLLRVMIYPNSTIDFKTSSLIINGYKAIKTLEGNQPNDQDQFGISQVVRLQNPKGGYVEIRAYGMSEKVLDQVVSSFFYRQ